MAVSDKPLVTEVLGDGRQSDRIKSGASVPEVFEAAP